MALNAASHNIRMFSVLSSLRYHSSLRFLLAGEKTGPITGQPPPVDKDVASDLLGSSEKDPVGQSAPGRDGGDPEAGKKIKSEKERTDSSSEIT